MLWLYDLPLWLLCLLITGSSIAYAVACTAVAQRMNWQTDLEDNQAAGALYAFAGVVYAVALALIVVSAQDGYSKADDAALSEANAASDLFRNVAGLGPDVRDRLQRETVEYVRLVVDDEWARQAQSEDSPKTADAMDRLVADIMSVIPSDVHEQLVLQKVISDADDVLDARRKRLFEGQQGINGVTWLMIVVGGCLILAFAAVFRWKRQAIQFVGMIITSAILGLMIFVIVVTDHPAWGQVSIQPDALRGRLNAFEHVRELQR